MANAPKVEEENVSLTDEVDNRSFLQPLFEASEPEEIVKLKNNLTAVDMESYLRKMETQGIIKIECD